MQDALVDQEVIIDSSSMAMTYFLIAFQWMAASFSCRFCRFDFFHFVELSKDQILKKFLDFSAEQQASKYILEDVEVDNEQKRQSSNDL